MSDTLHSLDYGIVLGYFVVLIGLGIYLQRKATASLEDYFLGGRNLPWWALGVSVTASWFSVSGTMVIVAFLYMLGPRGLYIEFRGGACLILLIPLLWAGKWHRRTQCITSAEMMIFRFGSGLGGKIARLSAALVAVLTTVGLLAVLVKGVGLFFSLFFPYSPMTCALILVVIATIYTVLSGFYGVVYTDIFQSVIILIVVAVISVMAFTRVDSAESIGALAQEITGSSQWLSSVPHWETSMPTGGEFTQYRFLFIMAVFYVLRNLLGGTMGAAAPNYFGARNDREAGLLAFCTGNTIMLRWPMMMGFAVLGIFLVHKLFADPSTIPQAAEAIRTYIGEGVDKSQWAEILAKIARSPEEFSPDLIARLQEILGSDWARKIQLIGFEGTIDPERILPAVVLFEIPKGMTGLILVTLLAAFMSTFDSILNMTSAFFTRDLYQGYLRPQAKNRELIYVTWAFCILIVVMGVTMAYFTRSINDIWGWLVMGLGAGALVPGLLMYYWWRFSGGAFAISSLSGGGLAVLQRLLWPWFEKQWGWQPMNEWQMFTYLVVIGVITSIIGVLICKPTERSVLENFYRKVRPFGIWGPLKNSLPESILAKMRTEHFYDIAALPFAFLWLVTLFLWPMQLVIHSWRDFGVTFGLFCVSLVGLYFLWYKKLPPADSFPEREVFEIETKEQ